MEKGPAVHPFSLSCLFALFPLSKSGSRLSGANERHLDRFHPSRVPPASVPSPSETLQATCANVGPRKVDIEVELGGGKGSSFLIVKDNGRGMNAKGLKDFATYFLTQKDRGVLGPQVGG